MITIAFHWWYMPIGLFLAALLMMWRAGNEGGIAGGIGHMMAALAFLGAALFSLITGLIK